MSHASPLISFGIPVRNGERYLPRAIDSLLAQDLEDIEVVICDNDSTDRTPQICQEYADRDRRVRFFRNETNIGQIDNFNRVLELSCGSYFRWMGADDRLESKYATHCVRELEQYPEAVAVTTYQSHESDDGQVHYAEYDGERLDSIEAHRRFCRMMWFFTADYRYIDPVYSLIRRDALLRTQRVRVVPHPDRVLAAELVMLGPFRHVPIRLAIRRREPSDYNDRKRLNRRYHPQQARQLEWSSRHMTSLLGGCIQTSDLTLGHKARCWLAVGRFACVMEGRRLRRSTRRLAGALLPAGLKRRLRQFCSTSGTIMATPDRDTSKP